MSTIPKKHAFVVLSADVTSKEYFSDGIQPTYLSKLDLHTIMRRYQGPMLYGRGDGQPRGNF